METWETSTQIRPIEAAVCPYYKIDWKSRIKIEYIKIPKSYTIAKEYESMIGASIDVYFISFSNLDVSSTKKGWGMQYVEQSGDLFHVILPTPVELIDLYNENNYRKNHVKISEHDHIKLINSMYKEIDKMEWKIID